MDINSLVKITSRAWSLKILALMHEGVPGRQAPLLAAAQASRTAFSASLNHLIELKLLERNPGHGHPLRPEFKLTPRGAEFAKIAESIVNAAPTSIDSGLLKKSWTVPVLAVIESPRHFIDIKAKLPTVTDRALSQSLNSLQQHDWLRRDVDVSKRPPRPIYQAVNTGIQISHVVNQPNLQYFQTSGS